MDSSLFSYDKKGNLIVLNILCEFKIETSGELSSKLLSLVEEDCQNYVLNLRDTLKIDSTAMGVLVNFYKQLMKRDKKLVICELSPFVKEIFEITNLISLFTIYDRLEEAIDSF